MKIGDTIIRLSQVDSTNNYAAKLISDGKAHSGTVILADEQTAGRGQRGASWHSKPGENILFSLVINPDNLAVSEQVRLTHFAALSLIEFLRKISISAAIKWPNDIYAEGKKIAGILIENSLTGDKIATSIIGIGLNINQTNFSDQLTATSIRKITGEFSPIENVLYILINTMNDVWAKINQLSVEEIRTWYHEYLYLLNTPTIFEDKEGRFIGTITGTSKEGLLEINQQGIKKQYDLKEIRFISQNEL